MQRREFLIISGAGVLGVASSGCAPDARYELSALSRPELLAAVGPSVTRAIGQRYLAMNGHGIDAQSLRRAILSSRPWGARLTGRTPSVAELINADFARGHTVIVDGWILAETEARQCALFSLATA